MRDIIHWRKQTKEFQLERKDECGGPWLLSSSVGLDLVSLKIHPFDIMSAHPIGCGENVGGKEVKSKETSSILTRISSPSVST